MIKPWKGLIFFINMKQVVNIAMYKYIYIYIYIKEICKVITLLGLSFIP